MTNPRHPGKAAIERMALRADPTRGFPITPLQQYELEVELILQWAVYMAQGGLDRFRREKS